MSVDILTIPVLDQAQIAGLNMMDLRRYLALHRERERRLARRRFFTFYPEVGPLRRELYPRHCEFFAAGAEHRERLALCANRVGKTEGMGGFETTAHLTGRYPAWWIGRRFNDPISAWMAGKTNETTRDILQAKMFGDTLHLPSNRKAVTGTGLIPGDDIGDVNWKRGSDLIDKAAVRHYDRHGRFNGWSRLGVKSYEQGRGSFEGTEQHVIWLDEEPELAIYTECLTRTMTTQGLILITFTPLEGMSEVVLSFLPGGEIPRRAGSEEHPHDADRSEQFRDPALPAFDGAGNSYARPAPDERSVVRQFADDPSLLDGEEAAARNYGA